MHPPLQMCRLGPGVGVEQIVVVHADFVREKQLPDVPAIGLQQQVVGGGGARVFREPPGGLVYANHQMLWVALGQAGSAVTGTTERIQHQWPGCRRQRCQQLPKDCDAVGRHRFYVARPQMPEYHFRQSRVQVLLVADNPAGGGMQGLGYPLAYGSAGRCLPSGAAAAMINPDIANIHSGTHRICEQTYDPTG